MDAAVVVGRLDVVVHGADLRVAPDPRVVVGRARLGHRPQRAALDTGQEDALADQPVGVGGVLAEHALLETGGEDVGDRLVQCTGLTVVLESGGVLGECVAQLVREHVDGLGEPFEDLAVPVAEHQLRAVPERVVVVALEVHGRAHRRALAVVRRPPVDLLEHGQRRLDADVRLVDRDVTGRRLAGGPHRRARQVRAVVGRVDRPRGCAGRCRLRSGRGADRSQPPVDHQRSLARMIVVADGRESLEQVRRDEEAAHPPTQPQRAC